MQGVSVKGMWTLILLDHNGHREEVQWKGEMFPPYYCVPIREPITSAVVELGTELNLPLILKQRSYKPSSIRKGKKMVIYLEETEGG